MDIEKRKRLEEKLKQLFQNSEKTQGPSLAAEEREPESGSVIRRRKGTPDKRILSPVSDSIPA